MKRALDVKDKKESLSPPPVKRKLESTITSESPPLYLLSAHSMCRTEKAVASFFTPTSKREPEPIKWRTVDNSLLVGKYKGDGPPPRRRKIAAFDFVRSFRLSPFYQPLTKYLS